MTQQKGYPEKLAMIFEAPLLATFSRTHTNENDDMSTRRPQGRVESAPATSKRRRAATTSIPLKTLCFNHESSLGIESILNYLPSIPCSKRSSWSAASFMQFKSKPASTRPRSTTITSSPVPGTHTTSTTSTTTISSLPTELLCLIFDSYSTASPSLQEGTGDYSPDPESHPYGFFSVSRDYVRTPLPLTQVCQRWRSTAIAHKSLWGSIALALQGPGEEDEEESLQFQRWSYGRVQLLKLFLARARGVPLRLALSASEETPVGIISEVLKLVCRHAGQWQEVRMDLCSVSVVQALLDELSFSVARNPKSTFDSLKSLHLELAVDDEDDEEDYDEERMLSSRLAVKDVYELILRRAPRLSELVLDDLFFIWAEAADYSICPSYNRRCSDVENEEDMVPWHQLKKLTINSNSISARKVLGICAKAVGLEDLKVWRVGCDGSSDVDEWDATADTRSSPSTVVLPSLRSLELTLVAEPAQILGSLSLPSLQRVDVDVQAIRRPWRVSQQATVQSILAPLNSLLEPLHKSIDVRCGIKSSCVVLEEGECMTPSVLDAVWMESRDLRALARSNGCVEVYRYGSRRTA